MNKILVLLLSVILLNLTGLQASAQEAVDPAGVQTAVDQALNEKVIQSGTLDLYDAKIDQVRNLRKIKRHDEVIEGDGNYYVLIDFRDINTGDVVTVEAEVNEEDGEFLTENFTIKDVQALNSGAASQEDQTYTDEQIQAFMKEYIVKQTEFNDGLLMLYDQDAEKMRNLKLLELNPEVRRLGILNSSSSTFQDADSGETLDIDIAVENKKGKLNIQALRIRNVRKGPQS